MDDALRPAVERPVARGRALHPLIPLAAAGALALVAMGFAWKQSQETLNEAIRTSRSLAVLVSLSDVERGLLHSDLRALATILNVEPVAPIPWSGYGLQDQSLAELKLLTADNREQQDRWSQLRLNLSRHQRLLEDSVKLAERSQDQAASRLLIAQANPSRAAILGQLHAMTRDEQLLLERRNSHLLLLRQRLQQLQALSLVAMLLLLGLNLLLLRRERQASEARLRALISSEQRFRHLFDNASVGMTITNLPGLDGHSQTLEANEAVATMLGYSRAELKTLSLERLCDPQEPPSHAAGLASLLDGSKASARVVQCYRHRNGHQVWVDEGLVLRQSSDAAAMELITIMLNITALKTEEQALLEKVHYTRTLIETSIDPLVTISPAGTIEDVNDATVQATGLPRGALQGRDFADFFTEPERARAGYQSTFQRGTVRDYPLTLRHVSGSLMPVLYNASTYRNAKGEVLGVYAAARDISQVKQMEEKLRNLNAELEARVQQRTEELTEANQELEAFAYSVSHDLRAPLRAVDGFSHKLLKLYGEQLDSEGQRLLQVVRDNAQRMGQLIDDLLRFSRLGRRELQVSPVDMETLAREVAADLLASESERQIEFCCGALPAARGDAAMLREVWANLIGNAIKFSRDRPVAHISVGGAAQAGVATYWVRDDGAGFDMAYADKLFGVFQRLHRQDEFEGTGVGLALAQRILHRHQGRIWGEGQPDGGATFQFTLPLPPALSSGPADPT
ncbi:MAG: PAS domain S-box protein [Synechococcaceae cyanobacterium ELA739]